MSESIRQTHRMAFVLKGYPRVSETFIAQEIHLLEQLGFEIEIFSMRKAREPQRQPVVEKIKAPITYLPEYILPNLKDVVRENLKAFALHPVRYVSAFGSALTKTIRTNDRSPFKRLLQAGWLVGTKNLGTAKSPVGHLHSHFIHTPTELTYYVSKISGLCYTISAHAKDIYTIPVGDVRDRVNASEMLMTCTEFNYDFLRAIPGIDKNKVHKVYHGIDLDTFRPREGTPPSRLNRFMSVGRLVPKKGYGDILEALRILKSRGVDFTYDVYGAGELKKELLDLRDSLGLVNEVIFHDTTTHPQIIARFAEGGLFLCGSRLTEDGDRDGIPNTVAEAMSMEVPVLATRVSGIPELIEDGVSGKLVPQKDPVAFANAIEELLASPERTLAMGRAGRVRVAQVFNCRVWINTCASLLEPFRYANRPSDPRGTKTMSFSTQG